MEGDPFECSAIVAATGELKFEMTEDKIKDYIARNRLVQFQRASTREELGQALYASMDRILKTKAENFHFTDNDGRSWIIPTGGLLGFGLKDPDRKKRRPFGFGFDTEQP